MMYYTIDVMDEKNLLAENLQEGFESHEEALKYAEAYEPEEGTYLRINTWEIDENGEELCVGMEVITK